MGALLKLNTYRYETQYRMFYMKGTLNLKLDDVSKKDAEKYIASRQRKEHIRSILRVV